MSEAARELFPEETVKNKQEAPMRWHGFLAKFMLYAAAAWHIFQAAWILMGEIYYEPAARDAVYASLPALRIADYTLAGLLILCAALQLISGICLNLRRRAGIRWLMAAYIMLAAAPCGHMMARFWISGLPPVNPAAILQTAAHLSLLLVNALYYHRRKGLFH